MSHVETDGAYETLLRDHQELVAQLEKTNEDLEALQEKRNTLLKCFKDGDVLVRDLDIPPNEQGYVRSLFRELHAWMLENN